MLKYFRLVLSLLQRHDLCFRLIHRQTSLIQPPWSTILAICNGAIQVMLKQFNASHRKRFLLNGKTRTVSSANKS